MTRHTAGPEHEFEAAHGLPEALPSDERLLWQGAPDWRRLAREALHVRGIAAYFGLLLVWRGATVYSRGGSVADAAVAFGRLLPLALLGVALFALIGFLAAKTTVYTLTNRRVVMRIGIVLTITFNLPFAKIERVDLRRRADGSGDLTLTIAPPDRIAWLHLWPHARPWHLKRPQPMLRALPEVERVASLLAAALAESTGAMRPAPLPPIQAQRPVPANEPHPLAA